RAFGFTSIEERNVRVNGEDASKIAPAQGRRLRSGDDLRLRHPSAIGGLCQEPCGVHFPSQGEQVSARRLRALDERVDGGNGNGHRLSRLSDDTRWVDPVCKKASDRRLRSRPLTCRECMVGLNVEDFTVGAKAIESRCVARRLSLRQDGRKL